MQTGILLDGRVINSTISVLTVAYQPQPGYRPNRRLDHPDLVRLLVFTLSMDEKNGIA